VSLDRNEIMRQAAHLNSLLIVPEFRAIARMTSEIAQGLAL